jgi:RNA polymerase subunit RPABC4/transcription elongation factor Spt4
MTNQIPIRGNVCGCGGVWFTYDFGVESDPDNCPYCNAKIQTECVGDSIDYIKGDVPIPEEYNDDFPIADELTLKKSFDKASGATPITLDVKYCNFCTNEIFLDHDDVPKAKYCPYCDGSLITKDEFDMLLNLQSSKNDQVLKADADVNELIGKKVNIIFKKTIFGKSNNVYIFGGVDPMYSVVKLTDDHNKTIWIDFNTIKSINVIDD